MKQGNYVVEVRVRAMAIIGSLVVGVGGVCPGRGGPLRLT